MELLWGILSLLIVFTTTVLVFQKLGSKSTIVYPPGRTGWPLLGENLDYFSKIRNGDNEKFVMERIKKYSSGVFKTSLLGQTVAVFSGPEGNKFLYSNENKLFQGWTPGSLKRIFPMSSNSNNEDSIRFRKMLTGFIKANTLKNYYDIMDSMMKQHLQTHWMGLDTVKAESLVRKYTFELACRLLLGVSDAENLEKLLVPFEDIGAGLISMPINFPGTAFHRAVKASKEIRQGIQQIVKQKKIDVMGNKAKSKDILSHMLQAAYMDGHATNDYEIASDLMGLLFAGHDTLSIAITFSIMYLAEHPDVYQQVLKEQMEIANTKETDDILNWEDLQKMRYTWNVACEVLRLKGPTIGGFKVASTNFTYAGYTIPKGWKLHYLPSFTHKNSTYFPNPEKFDPSRFEGTGPEPYTFVPFGGGPRMCPGNEYARAVILVYMHNVVTNFRWEKLIPNEKIINGISPSNAQGLPILLHPHNA